MELKHCLKFNYRGEMRFIICARNSSYGQIIDQAFARFNIPMEQRDGLVLTNGQGYVFEQRLFECFLLLFPCPEIVFYMRLDYNNVRRALNGPKRRRDSVTDAAAHPDEESSDYVPVPVHRQDAFVGMLPNVLRERQMTSKVKASTALSETHAPAPKRLRRTLYEKSRKTMPTQLKASVPSTYCRSIRI